jgi:hypothetical protein
MLVPLTLLSPDGATLAWFLGRIVVLVLACLALPVRREIRAAVLGVAGLSMPVLFDLNLGNLAALLTARGRWWGVALPRLAWLPDPFLPLVAIAGVVAPLFAGKPRLAYAKLTRSRF